MNYKIFKIISLFLILISCKNEIENNLWFLENDKDYERLKLVFNDYVEYFPAKGTAYLISSSWSLHSEDEYNIKLVFEYKDSSIINLLEKLENLAIAKYETNQKCLLVLNRFGTNSNYGYPEEHEIDTNLINQDCYSGKYPIPNFSNFSRYQLDSSECRLAEDFTVYVLECETGKFMEDTKLPVGKYMPNEWKHGYSKGLAVSEERNLVIHWVIIW